MNCRKITRILDDGDIASMTAKERGEVEAHLFACPECATHWKVHQRLVSGFAPPLPEGLMERARAMVAAGQASNTRSAPGRAILYGAILVSLAAAAMLGIWLSGPGATPAAVEAAAPVQPAPSVEALVRSQGQIEQSAAPLQQSPAVLPSGSYSVFVPPIKVEGDPDSDGNAVAQKFRDRVVARLGRVPGLVLVDRERASQYEVRITAMGSSSTIIRTANIDAAPSAVFAAEDAAMAALSRMSPELQRLKRPELERQGVVRVRSVPRSLALMVVVGTGFPRLVVLTDNLQPAFPGSADHVELSARTVVRELRARVFPANPVFERELLAVVGDSSEKFGERRQAFGVLLAIAMRRGDLSAADAAVVRAGAELALTATGPEREMLWDVLALTRNAELIPYLIRGLETVPTDTRLHLIKILANDFGDDARARAALAVASQQNSQRVVQMAAQREFQDESSWNEYVVATLNNVNLPDLQRLQPVADMAPDTTAFAAGKVTSKVQLDGDSIREVAALIHRMVQIRVSSRFPEAEITAARSALRVLATMENPAARDVMIDVLRATDPAMSILKPDVLTAASRQFPDDPKIRAVIEEMANSKDSPLFGIFAKSALQSIDSRAGK